MLLESVRVVGTGLIGLGVFMAVMIVATLIKHRIDGRWKRENPHPSGTHRPGRRRHRVRGSGGERAASPSRFKEEDRLSKYSSPDLRAGVPGPKRGSVVCPRWYVREDPVETARGQIRWNKRVFRLEPGHRNRRQRLLERRLLLRFLAKERRRLFRDQ